jgi:hypothetical protein
MYTMKNKQIINIFIIFIILYIITPNISIAGGACNPVSVNPTCPTLIPLVVGAPCVNGTTCSGGPQMASSCLFIGSECSWYSFNATSTDMFVNIVVTTFSGCNISSNVYESTGPCVGVEISCLSGTPLDDVHILTGLNIGTTYYVQICYPPGGPCGNGGSAEYCINVGIPDPPCDLCTTPCGTAAGYQTTPTVQQVVDDCLTSPFVPELQPSSIHTFCYDFQATNTTVDFNVIITSNCGAGNVSNLTWELYDITCGVPIQTGTLASLSFTPVIIGNQYVFCYTFTVPSTCTHSQHCPFFVGATPILLSTKLLSFTAKPINDFVEIKWVVENNENIEKYEIERSKNGVNFKTINTEITNSKNEFIIIDNNPLPNISYYRIKVIEHNGEVTFSDIVSVSCDIILLNRFNVRKIYPIPSGKHLKIEIESGSVDIINVILINSVGEVVYNNDFNLRPKEINKIKINMWDKPLGIYSILIKDKLSKEILIKKIVK